MEGNFGFSSKLLDTLKKYDNKAGVYALFFYTGHIWQDALGIQNMEEVKKAGEELFFPMEKKPELRYMFIAFRILWGIADQSITQRYQLFAGPLPMMKSLL